MTEWLQEYVFYPRVKGNCLKSSLLLFRDVIYSAGSFVIIFRCLFIFLVREFFQYSLAVLIVWNKRKRKDLKLITRDISNVGQLHTFHRIKSIGKILRKDKYWHNQLKKLFPQSKIYWRILRKDKYWHNQLRNITLRLNTNNAIYCDSLTWVFSS